MATEKWPNANRPKTAFITLAGLYKFNVIPFGICNEPETVKRKVNNVLRDVKWKTCMCYLDDIVGVSADLNTPLLCFKQVLTCLVSAALQLI